MSVSSEEGACGLDPGRYQFVGSLASEEGVMRLILQVLESLAELACRKKKTHKKTKTKTKKLLIFSLNLCRNL